MASIPALTDPLTGPAPGANITTANIFGGTGVSKTGGATGVANANTYITGQRFMQFDIGTSDFALYRKDHTAAGGWRGFAIKIPSGPLSGTVAVASWYNGTTKGGDIRLQTDKTLQIRNAGSSSQWVSPVLTNDAEYEVIYRVDQNNCRIKIFQNGTLIGSGDSGALTTGFTTSNPDNLRVGIHSSVTVSGIQLGAFRADDSTELTPLSEAVDTAILAGLDSETIVDATGSIGTPLTLVQASGPTSPGITGPVANKFTVQHPVDFIADMVLTLSAGAASRSVTIAAPGATQKTEFIRLAGVWT